MGDIYMSKALDSGPVPQPPLHTLSVNIIMSENVD